MRAIGFSNAFSIFFEMLQNVIVEMLQKKLLYTNIGAKMAKFSVTMYRPKGLGFESTT